MRSGTRWGIALGLALLAALAIAAVRCAVPTHEPRGRTDTLDPHLVAAVEDDAAVITDAGARRSRTPAFAAIDLEPAPLPVAEPMADDALGTTRASFCSQAAVRLCHARERCGCAEPDPTCAARTEASCRAQITASFTVPPSAEAPARADVEPAPDVRDVCFAALDALGEHCDLDRVIGACTWPLRERVGPGQPCAHPRGLCLGGVCGAGGCEALATEGQPASVAGCAPGLAADEAQVCRPRGRLGADCAADAQCEAGLRCREGRCDPGAGRMESCSEDECAFGLVCAGDTPEARRCTPPSAACSDARARCAVGYSCDIQFACVPSPGAGSSSCLDGTHCPIGSMCEAAGPGRCEAALCRTRALPSIFR